MNVTQVPTIALTDRISAMLQSLCEGLYEREEAMHLALLSALAGESIFLLGPPGVGKSLIARRLKFAFAEGNSFEYLMSKFSTPDEIFGPISIKKLKDEDKYERLTDNYLPGANIVFLDEIWKAGPAIQNALLTILNEKIYRNGEIELKVDVKGIITASNELPANNANLAPIWDRFLVRLEVSNIRQLKNFLSMITDTSDVYTDTIDPEIKLTELDLKEMTEKMNHVTVGPEVLNTIQMIKLKIEEHNAQSGDQQRLIVLNDRRWKKIVKLMRVSAHLNDRSYVNLMDCFLLKHCLWGHPSQQQIIIDIITDSIEKHGYSITVNMNNVKTEIAEFEKDVEGEIMIKNKITTEDLKPAKDKYFRIIKTAEKFKGTLITINDYRRLTIDEPKIINFFDEEGNMIHKISVARGKQENSIKVFHNSNVLIYKLETRLIEEFDIVKKTAHPVMIDYWNTKYNSIKNYLSEQLKHMDDNHPKEIDALKGHLFVDDDYVNVVENNHRKITNQLTQLQLKLEKIHFKYADV